MAITPVLKRFETTVYKPLAEAAGPLVQAAGHELRFYAQGATSNANQSIFQTSVPLWVSMYHLGEFKAGDMCYIENIPSAVNSFQISTVDEPGNQLKLINQLPDPGLSYDVALGSRLVTMPKGLS